jgi:hypothetical protein
MANGAIPTPRTIPGCVKVVKFDERRIRYRCHMHVYNVQEQPVRAPKISVVDPDPIGSETFDRIRIL